MGDVLVVGGVLFGWVRSRGVCATLLGSGVTCGKRKSAKLTPGAARADVCETGGIRAASTEGVASKWCGAN